LSSSVIELYNELISGITVQRLQKISVDIIGCYKLKNQTKLSWYADNCALQADRSNVQRLFSSLIQKYHPDKHSAIKKEIESAYGAQDEARLGGLKKSYLFGESPKIAAVSEIIEQEESYEYGEEDFAYREDTPAGEEPSYTDYEEPAAEASPDVTFYEALSRVFLGNTDIIITEGDLRNLDGDIDMSACDIVDLDGAEYCMYITSLNLSGNRIRSIDRLSKMTRLKSLFLADNEIEYITVLSFLKDIEELDLSDNSIEDITPLLSLETLVYCNLMNNPIHDTSVIKRLEERGIIVLF
jgi:Leucine-rich repeat (LRR) protein